MQEMILNMMESYGYLGIFLLITLENLLPVIPSEIILAFGGFMTRYTELSVWGVICSATAGSVFGAVLLYVLGRILGRQGLAKLFCSKLGRMLRLKAEDAEAAERWFLKHGSKAVFFCRLVPIVRSLISIPAGFSRIKFPSFLALTTAGTLIWNTILVLLGSFAGNTWTKAAEYFNTYSTIALIIFLLTGCMLATIYIKDRFVNR